MKKNNNNSTLNSRRNFIKNAFIFSLSTLGIAHCADTKVDSREKIPDNKFQVESKEKKQKYKIEIEIYEVNGFCFFGNHKKGDKFEYPKDWEKICPYLRGSMIRFI